MIRGQSVNLAYSTAGHADLKLAKQIHASNKTFSPCAKCPPSKSPPPKSPVFPCYLSHTSPNSLGDNMDSISSSISSSSSSNSNSSFSYDQTSTSHVLEQLRSVVNEHGHQSVVAIVDASKEITLGALRGVLEKLQLKSGDRFTVLGVLQQTTTCHLLEQLIRSMHGHRGVVAIVDVSKEITLGALGGMLEKLQLKPRDVLTVLGVLQQVISPMGIKTRADPNSQTGWNMNVLIEGERQRKMEEFDRNEDFVNISKMCERKQIVFHMEVKAGASTRAITVDGVKAFEPTLVILDRYMKEKKYFSEKLKCNVLRLKRNNTLETVRGPSRVPFRYEDMLQEELDYNSPKLDLRCHLSQVNTDAAKDGKKLQQPARIEDTMPKAKSMHDLHSHSGSPEPDIALDTNADSPMPIPRSQSDSKLQISKGAKAATNVNQAPALTFTELDPLNRGKSTEISESSKPFPIDEQASPGPDYYFSTEDSSTLSINSKFITIEISSSSSGFSECQICKYRSPNFGRELKAFDYLEIEAATNNFSSENFLSEGGFGLVYRGRLEDNQYIAVKQHKEASSQGEKEFRSEVEVLSYAQHKNVVTLLGYCSQDNQRLLVYEYVCNGSLDKHLSNIAKPLQWHYRKKIAEGTARGLRYLHEECRGGCIVHRDMRPNNILVTHDFEPRLGDFGLARSQKPLEADNQTRIVGSFGYLAPEYAESGKVSTKTDVYAFGMVLLELITGRKALDRTLPGQSLLAWARPLLDDRRYHELIDPLLMDSHDVHELYCMVRAAGLCLRKEPNSRPSMNQVVQILEGSMMNQLEEDSPTMSGSESFIQILETSPTPPESETRSHTKKKTPFTYYEML